MFEHFFNKDIRNIVIGTILAYAIIWATPHLYALVKKSVTKVSYDSSIISLKTWVATNLHISLTAFLVIITVLLTLVCCIWIYQKTKNTEPIKWQMDRFLFLEFNNKGMVHRIRKFGIHGVNITIAP